MAYDIVPYTPDLDAQIFVLQTHLWGSDSSRNAAYFRWKYADNPYFDEVVVRLALCDGRVVGMRGMIGTAWQVEEPSMRHLLPCTEDSVVAPQHRQRQLASQLLKALVADGARRGFPFAISLTAGPVTLIGSLAAGWRSPGSYQSAWRTRAAPRLVERLRHRARRLPGYGRLAAALEARQTRRLFHCLDRAGGRSAGRVTLARTARPQEMAELVARLPWDGRIRHLRDAEYLAWRFGNPLHEYRFLFWDDGGLQGYLVLQRYLSERADRGCVNITDWEAADERIRSGLLETALTWGRFARLHVWTVGVSDSIRTLLSDHGFAGGETAVRVQSGGLLVCRLGEAPPDTPWTVGRRNLLNIADWDLRMLYSMAG